MATLHSVYSCFAFYAYYFATQIKKVCAKVNKSPSKEPSPLQNPEDGMARLDLGAKAAGFRSQGSRFDNQTVEALPEYSTKSAEQCFQHLFQTRL